MRRKISITVVIVTIINAEAMMKDGGGCSFRLYFFFIHQIYEDFNAPIMQQFSYTCKHRVFKGCLEYKRKRKERRNIYRRALKCADKHCYRAGCVVLCIVCVCV